MTTPTFSPGVNPSYALRGNREWPVLVFSPTKPYDVVLPKTVQPLLSYELQYILIKDQLDYILSFFDSIIGPAGTFYWRPVDAIPSPLSAGPSLDASAGGALSQRMYYVRYSWYDSTSGEETKPSPASTITVAANYLMSVTVPYIPSGVRSWRVYASETEGSECLQGYVSNSRVWTEPSEGLAIGTALVQSTNNLKPLLKWRLEGGVQPEKVRTNRWKLSLRFTEVWI